MIDLIRYGMYTHETWYIEYSGFAIWFFCFQVVITTTKNSWSETPTDKNELKVFYTRKKIAEGNILTSAFVEYPDWILFILGVVRFIVGLNQPIYLNGRYQ
jgi:hypothetical protein